MSKGVKKPFYVGIECDQLKGLDVDGYHFEYGLYVTIEAGVDEAEVMRKALTAIAEFTRTSAARLNCNVKFVNEISSERAEIIKTLLENARPQKQIDYH